MKYKEIASALVGGAFFAVPYAVLALPLVPSLVIGAAAFGASTLVIPDVKEEQKIRESVGKKLEKAKKQNKQIEAVIPKIEDSKTKEHVRSITVTITKIIDTVFKNPKKIKKIRNFFDYYLPVLLNIILRYDEIENQKLTTKEGKEFMASAEKMIAEADEAFKSLLSNMYQSDMIDIGAEMKVFNSMLASDGVLGSEIQVKEDKNE
ncbi:MAG: 5-bromo-4-chloroindolyl phosphate hydrolysis family protein [Bacilli bacterium]|nr:5-bromo-4-chloroindolyl phosphate hydrolysis family protein [Bacilli bacterium]